MSAPRIQLLVSLAIGLAAAAMVAYVCSDSMRTSLLGRLCWRLELVTYDFRAANSAPDAPNPDIVLVTIDELSLSQLGVWPWSREYHARIIRNLTRAGAALIGLDVIMSTVSGEASAEAAAANQPLGWEPPLSAADLALERALAASGRTVLAANIAQESLPGQQMDASLTQAQFPHWRFEDAARGTGLIGMLQDDDGVIRRSRISRTYQDEQLFTMPVVLAALKRGVEPSQVAGQVARGAGLRAGDLDPSFLISFRTPDRGFTRIPYYRVLRGQFSRQDVQGKIVLIGATAQTLQDSHNTPLALRIRTAPTTGPASRLPGVEIIADALDTILRGSYIRRASAGLTLILACLIGALVTLVEMRVRPVWAVLAAWLPSQLGSLVFVLVMWQLYRLWVPVIPLALTGSLSYVGVLVYLELTSERQRRKLHQSWSQRVSPEVLQVILSNPAMTQVAGKKLQATVLFTDLQGFTTFCHASPPEVVVENLNRCLALITGCIRRHGGTVHKFIGDGVMAVFGDPVQQPDHAMRAIRSACDMQQEMERLRANLDADAWVPNLRVGIHTGELVAGDIGSGEMFEYTVIGDTVSTASRLEGLNKEYGTGIMISDATLQAAGEGVPARRLGLAEIRGRPEPMEVFGVDPWKPIIVPNTTTS